jgi:hypothetical protein
MKWLIPLVLVLIGELWIAMAVTVVFIIAENG